MATLTKSTGTVTLSGAVEKVVLPAVYGWVWFWNKSDSDMYAGLSENISEGADGVAAIPAGGCRRIQTDGFKSVYLLGTGNVEISAQNYSDCPFKLAAKGGEAPDLSAYAKTADVPDIKVNAAVNADTLGEKSADDFAQIIELGWDETDTKTAVGISGKTTIYRCANWTDFPTESPDGQGTLIAVNYNGSGIVGTDSMWVTQFFISARTNVVYKRFINGTGVDSWFEMYSAANKPYEAGGFSGTGTNLGYTKKPIFAIADDDGVLKFPRIAEISNEYLVSFSNLSDIWHNYIVFF